MALWLMNPTRIHEDVGLIPWPHSVGQGSGVAVSCGVGHRGSLNLAWLWPWCRPAAAAPIGPLAWEPPYATGAALKKKKSSNAS